MQEHEVIIKFGAIIISALPPKNDYSPGRRQSSRALKCRSRAVNCIFELRIGINYGIIIGGYK